MTSQLKSSGGHIHVRPEHKPRNVSGIQPCADLDEVGATPARGTKNGAPAATVNKARSLGSRPTRIRLARDDTYAKAVTGRTSSEWHALHAGAGFDSWTEHEGRIELLTHVGSMRLSIRPLATQADADLPIEKEAR